MRIAIDNHPERIRDTTGRGDDLGARIVALAHLATSVHMAKTCDRARAEALLRISARGASS